VGQSVGVCQKFIFMSIQFFFNLFIYHLLELIQHNRKNIEAPLTPNKQILI